MAISNNNYFTVQAFMTTKLGLSGNELMVYAIIYGYSQDGQSRFKGSYKYISELIGASKNTAIKAIDSLCKKELILKFEKHHGGIKLLSYRTNVDLNGVPKIGIHIPKTDTQGVPKIGTNNNIYNNSNNDSFIEPSSIDENSNNLFGEKEVSKVKQKKEKVLTVRQQIIDFWLKEFHPSFSFNATEGKKLDSLIEQMKKTYVNQKGSYTDNEILSFFKFFCLNLPAFYKTKKLALLDSHYDTIVEELKQNRNGQQKQKLNSNERARASARSIFNRDTQ